MNIAKYGLVGLAVLLVLMGLGIVDSDNMGCIRQMQRKSFMLPMILLAVVGFVVVTVGKMIIGGGTPPDSTGERKDTAKSDQITSGKSQEPRTGPMAVSQENTICPFCAEEIKAAAIKCKHCGSWLDGREE